MRASLLLPVALVLPAALVVLGAPGAATAGDERVKAETKLLERLARDPEAQDERAASIRRLGGLGTREAAQALVPLVTDTFEHLADHVVTAWGTALAGAHGADVQAWLTTGALAHKDPRVRRAAALALGTSAGPGLAETWTAALAREQDARVLTALAQVARAAKDGTMVPEAFLPHLAHPDGDVALAAAETAAAAGPAAEEPLRKALGHPHPLGRAGAVLGLQRIDRLAERDLARVWSDAAPEPRVALAETLPLRTTRLPWPGAGAEALATLLRDPSWRVRSAAIAAAVLLWERDAVPLLVGRLAEETGRLRSDTWDALRTLTGEDLGDDPDLWRAWWRQKGEQHDLGPRPAPDRFGRIRRASLRAASAGGGQVETRTTPFFDLPLASERLVFVFDLSGSMGKAARAAGGPGGESKLDVTRREFEKTMAALPAATQVDVVVYRYPSGFPPRPEVTRALGRTQPLSPATRDRVCDWCRAQGARGWGAFYEALVAASDGDVDTVVLLSDGKPSRGRYERPERLLEEWVRANRFRRVAVHTVLVGDRAVDKELMADLAWATWGRSTVADLD